MKKILIYSATRSNYIEDTKLYESIFISNADISSGSNLNVKIETFNKEGLSKVYNKCIDEYKEYDYIVFVHDDVIIDDPANLERKLETAHEDLGYDIVGLAGGINPKIQKSALWHLMCGGFGSGNLFGAVAHPVNDKQICMTNFGPTPSRVAIIDGLFMSIKISSVIKSGWRFNENYKFHHYDIASCLDANKMKLKIGVYPIWCTHNSPGLRNINDLEFNKSQDQFMKEYSNY